MPAVCAVNIANENEIEMTSERIVGEKIDLQWTRVIDASSYELQMRRDAGSWQDIGKVDRRMGIYSIHSIDPTAFYSFRVRACDIGGTCSPFSPEITADPPNPG